MKKDAVAHEGERPMRRRDFLGLFAMGAFASSGVMAVLSFIQFPLPALFPVASKIFKIGRSAQFPVGTKLSIKPRRLLIVRDKEGLYAMSTACTHLGCVVTVQSEGFQCPCHGAAFDGSGRVLRGPAPRALEWFEILRLPSGVLAVNAGKTVPLGTRYVI